MRICEWTGTACLLPLLAEFTTTAGPGDETVRVVPADEHYVVNWHTDEFALDPTGMYRITASVGGQELGHADVDVVDSGRELRNVNTDEFIPLKDGRTLPIKFRIEEGALAFPGAPVCGSVLDFEGGLAGLPDGWTHSIIDFPPLVGATPLANGRLTGQRTDSGERVQIGSGLPGGAITFRWDGSFAGSISGQSHRISLIDAFGIPFYIVHVVTSDFLYPRNPDPTLIMRIDLPGPVIVEEHLATLELGDMHGEARLSPSGVDVTVRRPDGTVMANAFLAEPVDFARVTAVSFDVFETDGDGIRADNLAVSCDR